MVAPQLLMLAPPSLHHRLLLLLAPPSLQLPLCRLLLQYRHRAAAESSR